MGCLFTSPVGRWSGPFREGFLQWQGGQFCCEGVLTRRRRCLHLLGRKQRREDILQCCCGCKRWATGNSWNIQLIGQFTSCNFKLQMERSVCSLLKTKPEFYFWCSLFSFFSSDQIRLWKYLWRAESRFKDSHFSIQKCNGKWNVTADSKRWATQIQRIYLYVSYRLW